MKSTNFRARVLDALRIGSVLAAAWVAAPAQAYSEFGYFSGAYATPGEGGCWGSDGQGINPYGGCTPGDYPLSYATAFVYGLRGQNNFASVTADIPHARLSGSSWFPDGASNSPGGAANLLDTLTITGSLPQPVSIVVTLTIDSTISATQDRGGTPVQAWLLDGGGLQAAYARDLTNCQGNANCDAGFGHTVGSISHTEVVDDAHRSFQVASVLYIGGEYLLVDASATLSLNLPQGLGYTSASGVFPLPAVPEPQTALLMLAGLIGVGAGQRRFKAAAASCTSAGPL